MTREEDEVIYDPEIYNNCRKITWSKYGYIIYASPDPLSQNNLCMTYMECIDGQHWQLSPPKEFSIRTAAQLQDLSANANNTTTSNGGATTNTGTGTMPLLLPPAPRIALVEYSPSCADVAIFDELGNLNIAVTGVMKPKTPSKLSLLAATLNELEVIYSDTVALGSSSNLSSSPSANNSTKIITFKWLAMDKMVIVNGPATKTTNTAMNAGAAATGFGSAYADSMNQAYQYNVAQHRPIGPTHPIGSKQAGVGVRANGEIDMWHQGEHGLEFSKISTHLHHGSGAGSNSNEYITHASIGFDKEQKLIIAMYSEVTKILQIVKLNINWGYLTIASQMQKKLPAYITPDLNKQQNVPNLKIEKLVRQRIDDVDSESGEIRALRTLNVISASHGHGSSSTSSSTSSIDILVGYETKGKEKYYTTVDAFQIDKDISLEKNKGSNSNDTTNGTGNGSSTGGDEFRRVCLTKKTTINCPDLLLGIHCCLQNNFVIFSYQNGKIEVRDRFQLNDEKIMTNPFASKETQKMTFNNPGELMMTSSDASSLELPQTFGSLFDAGFEFPDVGFRPGFIAMSPTLCSYVALNPVDKKLYWKNLSRDIETMMINKDQKKLKKRCVILTASAFAFTHTSACFGQIFTNDIVTTIQIELAKIRAHCDDGDTISTTMTMAILEECQKALNFQLTYKRENADKLLNHPPFQKSLSLQICLGMSMNCAKNKSAQFANYLLNLRLVALIITLTLRSIYQQMQKGGAAAADQNNVLEEANIRANIMISAVGFVGWFIDFCVLLNKQLIEMGDEIANNQGQGQSKDELKKIASKYVAIPFLFSSISRSLLLYTIVGVKRLQELSKKSVENIDMKNFNNLPMLESFERLNALINTSPIKMDIFEKFVSDTDNSIRAMNNAQQQQQNQNQNDDNQQAIKNNLTKIETQLFIHCDIPDQYVDPVCKLSSMYSKMAKKEFDMLELYGYDVEWLENINAGVGVRTNTGSGSGSGLRPGSGLKLETGTDPEPIPEPIIVTTTTQDNHTQLLNFKLKKNSLYIDELRKILIIGRNLRKCTLCNAISSCDEIPLYKMDFINPTTMPFQRSCFCGGYWVSL